MEEGKREAKHKRAERLNNLEEKDLEKWAALDFARQNKLWIDDFYYLGKIPMRGGYENTLVLNEETGIIFKSNNLANSEYLISNLFKGIAIHNLLFPANNYEFVGFTGLDNGPTRTPYVEPVFKQKYVAEATKAEPSEIKTYMESLGFEQRTPESYYNGQYLVSDLHPRNVLKDSEGNFHVVDAMCRTL
ncbi:hypothetical protein [Flagellimonas halotolerans]|uniref:Aminoglycoside phosphotransferase domain-containing protein n=1 Tax=Flagellimonas halotolerans TaxID=3112164 RepID=A0ABU6IU89_9FLAO|nr:MULTISPECIES: hypothetical protein [unclassified Allomuricauda]MEC3966789.1 hypothetical protein [Muricauda sp. SYSU M86414]MEC4266695.1 hypothetical protein [Muricauda sp. SYSU M84420]